MRKNAATSKTRKLIEKGRSSQIIARTVGASWLTANWAVHHRTGMLHPDSHVLLLKWWNGWLGSWWQWCCLRKMLKNALMANSPPPPHHFQLGWLCPLPKIIMILLSRCQEDSTAHHPHWFLRHTSINIGLWKTSPRRCEEIVSLLII